MIKTVPLNFENRISPKDLPKPIFRVGFASADWSQGPTGFIPNGCTWYRCVLPAGQLNLNNIHASVGFLGANGNGEFVIQRTDGVISEKNDIIVLKVIMLKQALENFEKAKSLGQKIVVDIDDFFEGLHPTNFAHGSTDPEKFPENNRDIYMQIIDQSDAIIVSTPFLYDHYKQKCPGKPIFMIRNSIDIQRYEPKKMQRRNPVIGWLGAVPWRSEDLEQLSGFFNTFLSTRHVRFHHAGHVPWAAGAHSKLKINREFVSVSPMVPLSGLPTAYADFDIGIVPLNDIPFNQAKSYIKGLEYAAAGVPFVASALPEYKFLAENGVGRVARTESEWIDNLDELLLFKTRANEAEIQYEITKSKFSINSNANEWVDVFLKIMDL